MPSKTPAQARLMRAVAHGWKKPGGGGPSPAVAREFVNADRMWTGGLAAMNEVNSGMDKTLDFPRGGRVRPRRNGGGGGGVPAINEGVYTPYGPGIDLGGLEPLTDDARYWMEKDLTKGSGPYVKMMRKGQQELRDKYGWVGPETTIAGAPGTQLNGGSEPGLQGPNPNRPRGGGRGGRRGGGGGRGGRGGGGGGGGPVEDPTCESGWRGRLGNCRPPPGGGGGGGGTPPGGGGGGGGPPGGGPPYGEDGPPGYDPSAGRDTEYSEALRAHKARVAASLAVPPGGYAGGGQVNYYDEGGAVRPGHAEGANPYPEGSARHKYWETRNHVAPEPLPIAEAPPEPEDLSWLERLLGKESDRQGRTEAELEELEEAYGGYIDAPGYQQGGLAAMQSQARGQMGQMGMRNPRQRIDPRSMPPQRGGRMGGRRGMPPRGMPPMRGGGRGPYGPSMPQLPPGKGPRIAPPPGKDPRTFPPRAMPPVQPQPFPPGKGPQPGGPVTMPPGFPGGNLPRTPSGEIDLGGGRTPEWGPNAPGGGGQMPQLRERMQQAQGQFGGRDPRAMPPVGGGRSGMLSRMQNQARTLQQGIPGGPSGRDPRSMPPQGPTGGPQVPPNMRGMLQKQRMMNRPPANVGGGANRVGMQDQQGGLSRALQRGTGRRPMSRRGGFPGRS